MKKRSVRGPLCEYCPGHIQQQKITLDYRRGDDLMVIENVPAGVCDRCREQYFDAHTVKLLEQVFAHPPKTRRRIQVPVLTFDRVA